MSAGTSAPPSLGLKVIQGGCPETVHKLQRLLAGALTGDVIGMAFCALRPGGNYFVDMVGQAKRNPTLTRGMVAAMDDELRTIIHAKAEGAPDLGDFYE